MQFVAAQSGPNGVAPVPHARAVQQHVRADGATRTSRRDGAASCRVHGHASLSRIARSSMQARRARSVESFFSTEMHSVQQGKYGQRYANVKPATVPSSIASYVRDASLSNVVIAETQVEQDGGARSSPDRRRTPTPSRRRRRRPRQRRRIRRRPNATRRRRRHRRPTSPTASPTSSPGTACNGAAADNGPLTNSSGTLATGVAKPFDFPVQHGATARATRQRS